MFAYCGNNSVNFVDNTGTCYRYANGKWIHDYWEYVANHDRKPDPMAIDITKKLDDAMRSNAETFSEYSKTHNIIDTSLYFASKSQPGGEWDFKSQSDWALMPNQTYIYNHQELRYDDIGNIHYGYVGREVFDSSLLLTMGGLVQIYAGTSKWEYRDSKFDDPRDQIMISYGCLIWDAENAR